VNNEIEEARRFASEIDGWLSHAEGKLLYELAKNVPMGKAIVEIGSWKGKSTIWLAKGAEAGHRNKVFAIDPHRGSESHVSEGGGDTYPIFLVNLSKARVKDMVVPLVMTSSEAARYWQGSVGLLWVDGSHEYEDVKHDFLVWKQYLAFGAMVVLHDCDKPGPASVAEEYSVNSNEFVITHRVDTILAARKCK